MNACGINGFEIYFKFIDSCCLSYGVLRFSMRKVSKKFQLSAVALSVIFALHYPAALAEVETSGAAKVVSAEQLKAVSDAVVARSVNPVKILRAVEDGEFSVGQTALWNRDEHSCYVDEEKVDDRLCHLGGNIQFKHAFSHNRQPVYQRQVFSSSPETLRYRSNNAIGQYIQNYNRTQIKRLEEPDTVFSRFVPIKPHSLALTNVTLPSISVDNEFPVILNSVVRVPQVRAHTVSVVEPAEPIMLMAGFREVPKMVTGFAVAHPAIGTFTQGNGLKVYSETEDKKRREEKNILPLLPQHINGGLMSQLALTSGKYDVFFQGQPSNNSDTNKFLPTHYYRISDAKHDTLTNSDYNVPYREYKKNGNIPDFEPDRTSYFSVHDRNETKFSIEKEGNRTLGHLLSMTQPVSCADPAASCKASGKNKAYYPYNSKKQKDANNKTFYPVDDSTRFRDLPANEVGEFALEAFYRHGGAKYTKIGADVEINVTGNVADTTPLHLTNVLVSECTTEDRITGVFTYSCGTSIKSKFGNHVADDKHLYYFAKFDAVNPKDGKKYPSWKLVDNKEDADVTPNLMNSVFYLGNTFGENLRIERNQDNSTVEVNADFTNKVYMRTPSTLENAGKVNLYGNKVLVANIDGISDPDHSVTFVNKGAVTGHNLANSFTFTKNETYVDRFGRERQFDANDPRHNAGTTTGDTTSFVSEQGIKNQVFGVISYSVRPSFLADPNFYYAIKNHGTVSLGAQESMGFLLTDAQANAMKRVFENSGDNAYFQLLGKDSVGVGMPNVGRYAEMIRIRDHRTCTNKAVKDYTNGSGLKRDQCLFNNPATQKNDEIYIPPAYASQDGAKIDDRNVAKGPDSRPNVNAMLNRLSIQLDKPIELFGDGSVGVSIPISPVSFAIPEWQSEKTLPSGEKVENKVAVPVRDKHGAIIIRKQSHLLATIEKKEIVPESDVFANSKLNIEIGGKPGLGGEEARATLFQGVAGNQDGGDNSLVENSIGINLMPEEPYYQDREKEIATHSYHYRVKLHSNTKDSIGIRAGISDVVIGKGNTLGKTWASLHIDGENNIGFLADNALENDGSLKLRYRPVSEYTADNNGFLSPKLDSAQVDNSLLKIYNTQVDYQLKGKNNILFAALPKTELKLMKPLGFEQGDITGTGHSLLYAEGKVSLEEGLKPDSAPVDLSNGVAFYVKPPAFTCDTTDNKPACGQLHIHTAEVPNIHKTGEAGTQSGNNGTIAESALGNTFTIKGKNSIGMYAENGGAIIAQNTRLGLEEGDALVYAVGENTKVDLQSAVLRYKGSGYAVYTDDKAKVDLSNATLALYGKALGFDGDNLANVTRDGANVVLFSNRAIIAKYKNRSNPLHIGSLQADLGLEPIKVFDGVAEDGTVFTNYKIGFVDGATGGLMIDKDFYKKKASVDHDSNEWRYLRNYAIARTQVTLPSGKKIVAHINSQDVANVDEHNAIGFVMSSSSSATSRDETGITLESGALVHTDRTDNTDKQDGSVGLFVDYGKITVKQGAQVQVETSNDAVTDENGAALTVAHANPNSIGLHGVNGSEVLNQGEVTVGGAKSIGLFGVGYKNDEDRQPIINEFGGQNGEGNTHVINDSTGVVTMTGEGARGIFVENNKEVDIPVGASLNLNFDDDGNLITPEDTSTTTTQPATIETVKGKRASLDHLGVNKGKITTTANYGVGMAGNYALLRNEGTILNQGKSSVGIYGFRSQIVNTGNITVEQGAAGTLKDTDYRPSIGMAAWGDASAIINTGEFSMKGERSIGLYGSNIISQSGKISLAQGSTGIYLRDILDSDQDIAGKGGSLVTGKNLTIEAIDTEGKRAENVVGIKITGNIKKELELGKETITLGDGGIAYAVEGKNITLTVKGNDRTLVGNKQTHIYSKESSNTITNNSKLISEGDNNYGLYGSGTFENKADIDFSKGVGNIAMLTLDEGKLTNSAKITVGASLVDEETPAKSNYSVGMAVVRSSDTGESSITNTGTIEVTGENGIGMYASGKGAKAVNAANAKIVLKANGAIGMYLAGGAEGENHGTIETEGDPNKAIGVLTQGGILKNYGTIRITGSESNAVYSSSPSEIEKMNGSTIEGEEGQDGVKEGDKQVGSVIIRTKNKPTPTAEILLAPNTELPLVVVDTLKVPESATPTITVDKVNVDAERRYPMDYVNKGSVIPEVGMYVDTSGVKFTTPIEGLDKLNLNKIRLIVGNEATRYTNSTAIKISSNISQPFMDEAKKLNKEMAVSAYNLTWIAGLDSANNLYLAKIPYADFADNHATSVIAQGLDRLYSKPTTANEAEIFQKLNNLGKGESALLVQSLDEMQGHPYATLNRRIASSKDLFDREFATVRSWEREDKRNYKLKAFVEQESFGKNQLGITSYGKRSIGLLGLYQTQATQEVNGQGLFFGFSQDKVAFKDIAGSKETALNLQAGYHYDRHFDNGSDLLLKAGAEYSQRKMQRQFFVVDKVYSAQSSYKQYGLFVDSAFSRPYALTENWLFKPTVGLDLAFRQRSKIEEQSGDLRLYSAAQNWFTFKPHLSANFVYERLTDNKAKWLVETGVKLAYDLGNGHQGMQMALVENKQERYRLADDNYRTNAALYFGVGYRRQTLSLKANVQSDLLQGNVILGLEASIRF